MIRKLRYYLTRMLFVAMGLRVAKWRKQAESLWKMGDAERSHILDEIIGVNRPMNADGVPVTSLADIETSPVMTKHCYREITAAAEKLGTFKRETSGTTGEPIKVSLSREELSRMLGVRDYCFRHYGFRLGDREARFWGRPERGLTSKLKNFVLNRKVCFPMGDQAAESVDWILRGEPDYLYGYASLLLEAAALIEKHSLRFTPPKCLICTAETIIPAQKDYLATVFKAPVVEEYGATEFDIVAFECRSGHRHIVNPWLIVRERGGSLLVSDVSRRSASLVNYDIGDSGTIENFECGLVGGSQYLSVLEGRSIHRFAYIDSETRFHSVDLAHAINEYQRMEKEIFSFRFLQTEYGVLDLYVSTEPSNGLDTLQNYMENDIRDKTGRDIVVRVCVGEKPVDQTEKSYFVQRIQDPAEDVASI